MTATLQPAPATTGAVMRMSARSYDLLVWLLTLGREGSLRERMLAPAQLREGEAVLDVGCGTGTLAIAARRHVGARGMVRGIDPSPDMIARAERKARRRGAAVAFSVGIVEALPFPDASFDVILSTLMLHHLPRAAREQGMREVRRVLKPGGRVLAIDFGQGDEPERRGFIAHFHRHGGFDLARIVALLEETGFTVAARGGVGSNNLQYALGTRTGEGA